MSANSSNFIFSKRVATGFYDMIGVMISISDVVTDFVLAHDYYVTGKTNFFRAACTILLITQISYTALFVFNYFPNPTLKKTLYVSFCVFPFAQFVPVFIWLDSLHIPCLRTCYKRLGLQPLNHDPDRIDFQNVSFHKVLYSWIRSKAMAHFGFIVEAILEAFPQCILQMVCIIWYQEASPLAMYSILLSVTTIASKGVVFSFSIDPIVFVFNVCCVLIDIFGFFATLTWICYLPAQHSFITWLFWLQFRLMVTFIMLVVLLIVATLIVGPLLVSLYHAVDDIGQRTHSWSHFFQQLLAQTSHFAQSLLLRILSFYTDNHLTDIIGFHFVISISLMVVIFVPCLVIMLLQVFNLMFISSWFIIEEVRNAKKTGFVMGMNYILNGRSRDERGLRFTALLAASNPDLQRKQLRQVLHECSTKTIRKSFWDNIFWMRKEPMRDRSKAALQVTKKESTTWRGIFLQILKVLLATYVCVCIPGSLLLSILTNLSMPIVALITCYNTADNLQIYMSAIYAVFCFVALCLFPYTVYFRYWQFHVGRLIKTTVSLEKVISIQEQICYLLEVRKALHSGLQPHIASIVSSYLPQTIQRVNDRFRLKRA